MARAKARIVGDLRIWDITNSFPEPASANVHSVLKLGRTPRTKPPCARSSSTEDGLAGTVEVRDMDKAIADFAIHLRDRKPVAAHPSPAITDLLRRFARFACAELHQDTVAPGQIDKALVVLFVREGGVAGGTSLSRQRAIQGWQRYVRSRGSW